MSEPETTDPAEPADAARPNESATATASGPPHVLVVVSSATSIPLQDGKTEPTGTYLSEVTDPIEPMLDAGFELTFTTPDGRAPTIDGASVSLMYFSFSRAKRDAAFRTWARLIDLGLGEPVPLAEIVRDRQRLETFDAIYVPGGHAPLVDLLYRDAHVDDSLNEDFGALLSFFHETGRTTGLLCHGPATLATARDADGRWLYDGYRMTVFKTLPDLALQTVPFARRFRGRLMVEQTRLLEDAGARIEQTVLPMGNKVVEDRELITGQDPFSGKALGEAFVAKVLRSHGGRDRG